MKEDEFNSQLLGTFTPDEMASLPDVELLRIRSDRNYPPDVRRKAKQYLMQREQQPTNY